MSRIAVAGAGTWGIALARMLLLSGHEVSVWSALPEEIDELSEKNKNKTITGPEEKSFSVGRLVQEMYARGFEFLPMDLYESDARYFKVIDGKLLPPFNVIAGLGDTAAEELMIAATRGKFLSKDDLRSRGKISQTILETFDRIGLTSNMTQSNQMSLFDM